MEKTDEKSMKNRFTQRQTVFFSFLYLVALGWHEETGKEKWKEPQWAKAKWQRAQTEKNRQNRGCEL